MGTTSFKTSTKHKIEKKQPTFTKEISSSVFNLADDEPTLEEFLEAIQYHEKALTGKWITAAEFLANYC